MRGIARASITLLRLRENVKDCTRKLHPIRTRGRAAQEQSGVMDARPSLNRARRTMCMQGWFHASARTMHWDTVAPRSRKNRVRSSTLDRCFRGRALELHAD